MFQFLIDNKSSFYKKFLNIKAIKFNFLNKKETFFEKR